MHCIRRKLFGLVFVVFFVLRVGFSVACTMLPRFYLFIIYRYLRFLQPQQWIRLVSPHILPCRTIKLNFSEKPGKLRNCITFTRLVCTPGIQAKTNICHNRSFHITPLSLMTGLGYTPTSTVSVNVPMLSRLQWHPFSFTSSSSMEPNRLSILIKSEGSWSKLLYQILSSNKPAETLQLSLEGPYGPPPTDFLWSIKSQPAIFPQSL